MSLCCCFQAKIAFVVVGDLSLVKESLKFRNLGFKSDPCCLDYSSCVTGLTSECFFKGFILIGFFFTLAVGYSVA